MQDLNLTIIQTSLYWNDRDRNISMFENYLSQIQQADLIVFPEMFNTGFVVEPETAAETMEGPTVKWLKNKAAEKNCVLTGSLIIRENGNYFNRLIWARPDGTLEKYDKRHLFSMGGEGEHFSPGRQKIVVEINGWNVCPLVCYDLRFPVWSKNKNINRQHEFDVLIYVANWPQARNHAWKSLLTARAIENQCYVVGVNRIGKDGNEIIYSGDSIVLDAKGWPLTHFPPNEVTIESTCLKAQELIDFRKAFQVNLDWDDFSIN